MAANSSPDSSICVEEINQNNDSAFITLIESYLQKNLESELEAILLDEDSSRHYAINIDVFFLANAAQEVLPLLLDRPKFLLATLDQAVKRIQTDIIRQKGDDQLTFKKNLHVRLYNADYANVKEIFRYAIPQSDDVGRFVSITGSKSRFDVLVVVAIAYYRIDNHMIRTTYVPFDRYRHQVSIMNAAIN